MADDAGKKVDQPSEQAGSGTPAKEELQTQEAAQAVAQEEATEAAEAPKPKAKRKPAAKKAEGTAAAKTKVEKEAAEATTTEGASEAPAEPVAETKAEDKPKPRRRSRKAAEPEEAPKPAPRRKRDAGERVTVRAHAKYVRTSARKARLVADHVKGKDVAEARALLAFSPRSVAEDWRKLLESAIANAEHNHDLVGEDLRVLNATADEGPTLKRFRPRAMGRATRIRKRTSHLTITLTPKEN
jgi:ribosomal protein L22